MGTIGIYPKFRADDRDGNPLEGGKLYSFLSGTSTPQSMYADAELTTPLANPIILDASGEALFYTNGQALKWVLRDQDDVLQWEIDPAVGVQDSAAAAGLGWGKNTVRLQPLPGTGQVSGAVFPPDVLAFGLTVWIETTLGTSQGLQQVGIGTLDLPDCWGLLPALTGETGTTAGLFQVYSGKPQPQGGMVTLTAYGGLFDGTGTVYVTGHFVTFRPGHEEGYLYTPTTPEAGQILPPQPPATEATPGLIELLDATEVLQDTDVARALTIGRLVSRTGTPTRLGLLRTATPAAVVTGTNDTDAATPLGVAQALSARLPAGTPLSVTRYAASGAALEASPSVVVDASGRLGVGTTTPETGYGHTITAAPLNTIPLAVVATTDGTLNQAQLVALIRRTTGDMADRFGCGLSFQIADATASDQQIGQVLVRRQGADNSGRFLVKTVNAGVLPANTAPGDLAVDPLGNVSLNVDVFAAGGTRVLALGSGTAPSTRPADAVQLGVRDRGGVAGKASLVVDTEDGTSHVLGDQSGIGTLCAQALGSGASYQALSVKGSHLLVGQSSVQERPQALIAPSWVVSTDATRTARLTLSVYDATAAREGLRLETSGTAPMIGFLGATAVGRQTLAAAATDAATTQTLANSLRTALIALGLGG